MSVTAKDVAYGLFRRIERYVLCRRFGDYVERSIEKRRGSCRRCGKCCVYLFIRCRFLKYDEKGRAICPVYPLRPKQCRAFPINQRDIDEISKWGVDCGYYFDGS